MADAQIKITADTSQAERALGSLNNSLKALAAVAIGGSLFKFVDDLQTMQNKLRVATKSNDEFQKGLAYIKAIADSTGQSMNAVGDVYAKVSANADKLGYNQAQVATTTNALAMALKASGATAEGAKSTLYQFGQILNKGKVSGDEFTTVLENFSGPVTALLAKNMGLTTAELIKFKEKGLVNAKDFTDALIKSTKELGDMQGKTLPTLSQSIQKIQNAFGDFIIKLDKATGITNALAKAMDWLSKNVDTVLPLIAAFAGYFVAGRILSFAVAAYEVAKGIRAIGIAASVAGALATGGISALTGLAGAALAYAGASALFDKVDGSIQNMNVDLNKTAEAANNGLGATNGQLTGIQDKLNDILKDYDEQIKLNTTNSIEYKRQSDILGVNKQLQYSMTAAQKEQLATRLKQLDALKLERDMASLMLDSQLSIRQAMAMTTVEQRTATEFARIAKEYGMAAAYAKQNEIKLLMQEVVLKETSSGVAKENIRTTQLESLYRNNLNTSSAIQLDIQEKILKVEQETGILVPQRGKDMIARVELLKKELEYMKSIRSSLDAVNKPLGGAAAGAGAASQLGSLDAVTAAKTANESLFNGLKYLRDADLISEQQYQTAKVSATISAEQAMFDATKKRFENEALLRIQAQTGSQFGFETQKALAAEAASFEKKSTLEKYQFAIDQGAQMYSALGAQNKSAFEAAKAFNIANAIMNTYMAATKALAAYPPPFSFIAAAAAVGMGLAQVAAIRSQSYSGRALGGPVMGGQSYIVGENGPELFTPQGTGSITRNGDLQAGGPTNINFTIVANDSQGFDTLLVQRRGMITQMVNDAMLERGQRIL